MTTNDPGSPNGPAGPAGTYVPPPPPPPPSYVPPVQSAPGGVPPADVGTVKIFFIVSLVVNALAALTWMGIVFGAAVATCGIGCLLIVVPAVPVAATVLDAMALAKMGQPPVGGTYGFLKTAAIMDIIAGVVGTSVVPLVMGILILVFLAKPDVQRYYGANSLQ